MLDRHTLFWWHADMDGFDNVKKQKKNINIGVCAEKYFTVIFKYVWLKETKFVLINSSRCI